MLLQRVISSGQKCDTESLLGIEFALRKVHLLGGGGVEIQFFSFCVPAMCSVCSHMFQVIFPKFSMCCSRVFPIAPHFYPIWLPKVSLCPKSPYAQSLPSQVYNRAKGETLHLHIQNSIPSKDFVFSLANQNGSLQNL